MLTIPTNTIKAAVFCAATKDLRYYLNGVFFKAKAGTLHIVSTQGHMMTAFSHEVDQELDFEVIVPIEAIKLVAKSKSSTVTLTKAGDHWTIGEVLFKEVEGKYPDYLRIIPKSGDIVKDSNCRVNPEYALAVEKAFFAFGIAKFTISYTAEKLVIHDACNNAVGVVMTRRNGEDVYQGFKNHD